MGSDLRGNLVILLLENHKILDVYNKSRCGHSKAWIVQDEFAIWIQAYPMRARDTLDTKFCLQRFLPPSQKPERTVSDNSLLIKACQELEWNHDLIAQNGTG